MTSVSKWVAAGSSAAVFAGGLLIAAPMASAAPGDAACLEASVQFEAALGAAGITETSVADIEAASRHHPNRMVNPIPSRTLPPNQTTPMTASARCLFQSASPKPRLPTCSPPTSPEHRQ